MKLLDRIARRYLRKRGCTVRDAPLPRGGVYALKTYANYDEYVRIQTEGNKRKIGKVWADEPTIGLICDYIRKVLPNAKKGLCHGSRNGAEVEWFKRNLGIHVQGTDISDTASQFGLTQWDFHEVNPEWEGQFDFIYTNSHDHAYDPKKAFATWIDQLAPGGKLFVEHHMVDHSRDAVSDLDPFGVDARLLPFVILQFAGGKFAVTDMFESYHDKEWGRGNVLIFVITRVSR